MSFLLGSNSIVSSQSSDCGSLDKFFARPLSKADSEKFNQTYIKNHCFLWFSIILGKQSKSNRII